MLIDLADTISDLSMHCQEQRAGAATGKHLVHKARQRSGIPRSFLQTRFIDTMILINPASTYVSPFQSRPRVHNHFFNPASSHPMPFPSIQLPFMLGLFLSIKVALNMFYLAMLVQLQDIQTIGLSDCHPQIHGPTIHSN